ncbi:MAG TPA: TIGR03546 family protein [Gemmatimonadales bacterium]|nr:TIGR03546 family protein [Gemmatimonadales bacterium]
MLALIKLVQNIVGSLNSQGTPGQMAAGIALGSALGLTPLVNLHNLVVLAAGMLLNVSFPGVLLGWALFVPIGFAMDPLFHAIGRTLLIDTPALTPLWTAWFNTPVIPLTNFNNTIVLGSVIVWAVLYLPLFFALRWAITQYRERIYARLRRARVFRVVTASKLYNVYRLFRP